MCFSRLFVQFSMYLHITQVSIFSHAIRYMYCTVVRYFRWLCFGNGKFLGEIGRRWDGISFYLTLLLSTPPRKKYEDTTVSTYEYVTRKNKRLQQQCNNVSQCVGENEGVSQTMEMDAIAASYNNMSLVLPYNNWSSLSNTWMHRCPLSTGRLPVLLGVSLKKPTQLRPFLVNVTQFGVGESCSPPPFFTVL